MAILQRPRGDILGAAILLVALVAGGAWYALHSPVLVSRDTRVIVAPGEAFARVAEGLAERGILTDARPITWYAAATGAAKTIRSGEYALADASNALDVLRILRYGTPVQYTATLVDGWTVAQTLDYLATLEPLRHTLADVDAEHLMGALGFEPRAAEGWFFPDTYRFERGTEDVVLLKRAHLLMQEELDRAWQDRDEALPYREPYQLLIMASLVEKETGLDADRAKIARVFVSRLERGMRLQTDPTVIYGLGETFDGDLTRRHLELDGPFNTYRRHGLPPTPIALPGRRALRAAAHPDPVPYLYFVARGDGTSQFSTTLDEHLAAVRHYQLQPQ